jgi:hypothetical protein
MKNDFHVDRGSDSTTHESQEAIQAIEPNRPENNWEFVSNIQQLLGGDAEPDPLFFVESWTQGIPVAVGNWQKRRQGQAMCERQRGVFPEFGNIGVQPSVQQGELSAEFATSSAEDAKSGHYGTGRSQYSFKKSLPKFQASQEWTPFVVEGDGNQGANRPMSQLRACKLLGVAATSTRNEIKAAYRRVVNQIHPDRLEDRDEGVRRLANDQMAEINEAYRLLCSGHL